MKKSKVKIKLNSAGIKEILKSQMMMDAVMDEAEKLGDVDTNFVGHDRCHVVVEVEK